MTALTQHAMPKTAKAPWLEVIGSNRWVFGADNNKLKLTPVQLGRAMSHVNRWTGNNRTRLPHSVAQHCVLVSELLDFDARLAMAGLLHDAPEIIIGDWSTPLKWFVTASLGPEVMKAVDKEEARVWGAIVQALGLAGADINRIEFDAIIKHADIIAGVTEKRDLLCPRVKWENFTEYPRLPGRIKPWEAGEAARRFARRFAELKRRLGV